MKKTISILIPFYNEKENLPQILKELNIVVSKLSGKYNFEVMLLDNHSSDGSHEICLKLLKNNNENKIRLIRQSRNFGYQANILAGYINCLGDCAIQLDADGEDDPSLIPDFIEKWEEGHQVVYGVRLARKESLILTLQRKIFYRILHSLSELEIPVDAGDFRLVDRRVIDVLKGLKEANPYIRGLLSYIGFNQIGIPYKRRNRYAGISKFSWFDYMKLSWDAITSFSKKPLTFIALIGLTVSILSVLSIASYLALYLSNQIPVKGFTTLILFISFFSGVQLLSLGVVAIYIGRIFDEVKKRPVGIVERSDS